MKQRAGLLLLVVFLLLPSGIRYGRAVFSIEESPPAFFVPEPAAIWVELGEGFPRPGVHQFIDGSTLRTAIEMTFGGGAPCLERLELPENPLKSGEALSVIMKHGEIININRSWMAASQRMVLAIPLRPETMSSADWLALPGIGPKLAARIEKYRQKN